MEFRHPCSSPWYDIIRAGAMCSVATTAKRELVRRCFLRGYVIALRRQLRHMAGRNAPVGCNYINPHTLEFEHRCDDDDDNNFDSPSALRKYGRRAINDVPRSDIVNEWQKQLCMYPQVAFTSSDLLHLFKYCDPFEMVKSDDIWMAEIDIMFYEI